MLGEIHKIHVCPVKCAKLDIWLQNGNDVQEGLNVYYIKPAGLSPTNHEQKAIVDLSHLFPPQPLMLKEQNIRGTGHCCEEGNPATLFPFPSCTVGVPCITGKCHLIPHFTEVPCAVSYSVFGAPMTLSVTFLETLEDCLGEGVGWASSMV